MAADFRCRQCGGALPVEVQTGQPAVCPHCRPPVRQQTPSAQAGRPTKSNALTGRSRRTVERAMPWVVSLLAHVALAVVLWFAVMLVLYNRQVDRVTAPDAFLSDDPGGVMNPADRDLRWQERQRPRPSPARRPTQRPAAPPETKRIDEKIALIGVGAAGDGNPFRLDSGSQTSLRSTFFGKGGNAHHVVYVVDCSGSMLDSFDYVRLEMLRSVSRLTPPQDFHVILFYGDGKFIEAPPKRLVSATAAAKERVAEFLGKATPQGSGGGGGGRAYVSNAIPALQRAFAVLSKATARPGKLVYLLSDGMLGDAEVVLADVRKANRHKDVAVNTYLFWFKDSAAVDLMQRLAGENGGQFKYISPDE